MIAISLEMQWPLTFQSHGSVSQREQSFDKQCFTMYTLLFVSAMVFVSASG
jgi:hypothetical protein